MKLREESIKTHRHLDKHKPFLNIWNIRRSTDRSILYFNVCSWNPFCKIILTSANFKAVGKTDWVIQSFRFEKTKPDKKSSNTFILMLARSRKYFSVTIGFARFLHCFPIFTQGNCKYSLVSNNKCVKLAGTLDKTNVAKDMLSFVFS